MNKIYKLIWSKVKNMWVVASELAKNHTKSPKSGIVGSVSLVSLESKINMDLSKGFVAGVFPVVNTPAVKSFDFKITVAAIVKNEAENVPTWVQAARSCADEIVVVDTGSTDGTVERFADYGIKCFHYDWHDDFASAKNYMISLCHGDWIVLLDGDEWFREGCDVRKAIAKHHGNPVTKAIIADWICLDKDRNNAVMFSGGAVRAFRNQPDVRYFRKVHENLTINYENFAFEPDFKMYHTGYSGSVNRSKHERNLRIMRTMFDFDNGKVEYPTDWRYIEDTYAGLGQFDKALWAADKMISYGVQEYSAAAWITKFNVLFAMKTPLSEMRKQFEYCFQTVPSVSGFRFLASIYYFRNGLIAEGLDNYIEGLRMLMGPQDKVAMEHTFWRMYMPEASALASTVYLQNKQVEAALYACKVCEQYCGQTDWTNRALADVHRIMNHKEENLLGNISERVLPVLQFGKKAVLATALASSLTIGMVGVVIPVYAASCDLNGSNCATGTNATVTGGYYNTASGCYSSISGGYCNTASGCSSSVSGGQSNTASGCNTSVSGGANNFAGLLYYYTDSSGKVVYVSANNSAIVTNGSTKQITVSGTTYTLTELSGKFASISGGYFNTAGGCYSSISGGACNTASGSCSSISGGQCNIASGCYSSISGGTCNLASGCYSSISGGCCNTASGNCSSISGGACNIASGSCSSISGGQCNIAIGCFSSVGGGFCNTASGCYSSVSGGYKNTAGIGASYVKNGVLNFIRPADYADSISGNQITLSSGTYTLTNYAGCSSSVLGGFNNMAIGNYATVSAGNWNVAAGNYSSVSGGTCNQATGMYASISGGCSNVASGCVSSVAGGKCNTAGGCHSSIIGGFNNQASGEMSFIGGGSSGTASAKYAVVIGGYSGTASGNNSIALGGCASTKAYANYSTAIGGGVAGVSTCANTAQYSVAIGKCATTTRDYEVAIGSSCAPVKIGGNMTVIGTNTVTDGTTTKTWTELLNASGGGGGSGSTKYIGINSASGGGNETGGGAFATDSIAIGKNAQANYTAAIAIGLSSQATNNNTNPSVTGIAIGSSAEAAGGISIGNSTLTNANSLAIGHDAMAIGDNNISIGYQSSDISALSASDKVVSFGHVSTDIAGLGSATYGSDLYRRLINVADGINDHDVVTVGQLNTALANVGGGSPCFADGVVLAGCDNTASGCYSSVSGGCCNIANGEYASVSAGWCNTASGIYSSVTGGECNTASGEASSVSGGYCNTASGLNSLVSGGRYNVASGDLSFVSGGSYNTASCYYSSVSAGYENTASGCYSSVSGGRSNTASGYASSAIGGCNGFAYACYSTVIGGGIAGVSTCATTALGSVAIGKNAVTTKNYEVAIGSANAPVTIGGTLTVTGTQTVTDGTNTKTWTDIIKGYTLPAATSSALGGVKIGSNITNTDGTISLTKANVTAALGYTPPTADTDTHYTTHLYAGSGTAANVATTNGNTKLAIADNSTVNNTVTIKGTGATTVTSDANGVISINGSDIPTGFTSRTTSKWTALAMQDDDEWVTGWQVNVDGSPADIGFFTRGASLNVGIDGSFYQNEGRYKVLDTSNLNGAVSSGNTGILTGGTAYTELRPSSDGTFAKKANTTAANITALDTAAKNAIKGLSVSGQTVTYTKGDGTTGTITTQDNNTTYSAGNGVSLSGTMFSAKPYNGITVDSNGIGVKAGTNVTVNSNGVSVTGSGSVASGNTGLISGGTLFTEGRITADGTFAKKANSIATNISALDTASKNAIKGLSVSGQTITYTRGDGTTGTITTQDNNTTYSAFIGATSSAAGTAGLVKAPAAGDQNKFLRGDGTWAADNNTTYSAGTGLSLSGTTFSVNTNGSIASGNTGVLNGGTVYSEVRPTADGTFAKKANTTAANITALDTAAKNAIKGLSVSGQTITYTKGDGTTGTITTQDNNTIYDNMSATELSTGTATTARSISAKTIADYVTGKVSAETTARTSAVSSEATARANADTALGTRIDGTIKDLSVSGRTITYTKGDGTTGTITTQDNNTTYDNMTASELSTGSATTARTISAKVISDYVTGKVSAETTARTTAINSEATTRANADTALGTRIDNAITAYQTADTDLSNRIGSLSADGNYIKKSATNNVSANLTALDTQLKTTVTALGTESTNRTNADTALSNRIGSVASDGTFIKKSSTNDVAANLTALDTAAKNAIKGLSVSGQTITYTKGDGTTGTITTQDNNTTYDNMTAAELSTGTATTARSISAKVLADYVVGKVSDESTARTTAINTEASTRQSADTALGTRIDNAITAYESADTGLSNRIGSLSADGNYIKKSATNNVSANLTALDTQLKATTTALGTETTNRTNADTDLSNRIGTVSADGNYIKKSTTKNIAENLGLLDTQVKANATAIATEVTNRTNAVSGEATARSDADTALSNRIDALSGNTVHYDGDSKAMVTLEGNGGTTISNVKLGTLSASSTEAVNGSQLYTTNQNLAQEITNRANEDTALSNRIGTLSANGNYITVSNDVLANVKVLDTKIGAAASANGTYTKTANTVNANIKALDTQLKTVTDDKANKDASNVSDYAGQWGVAVGTGKIEVNNTQLVTGGTVWSALQSMANKADKDASNISSTDAANWGNAIGLGQVSSGESRLVTGKTVYDEVRPSVDKNYVKKSYTTSQNLEALDTQLKTVTDGLASGLSDSSSAIAAEAVARENADTALSDRIGMLNANGNYILKNNNVSGNLSSLDAQLKVVTDGLAAEVVNRTNAVSGESQARSNADTALGNRIDSLDGVAVKYDTTAKSRISLEGAAGTTIDNVKDGILSADSKEAVNGSQLYSTNQALAQEVTDRTNAVADEISARQTADTALGARIDTEIADRQTAVSNEATARSDADAALGVRIDNEITARENAISQLSQDITTLGGNAVQYDGADKSKVTLDGTNGTTIDNVKAGTLSANSKEAVNGSQLYSTNQALAQEISDRQTAVSAETTARESSDTALGIRIDTESSSRESADTALGRRIDTEISDRQTAVSNEATTRSDADTALGVRIDDEITARENAISQLSQDITTLGGNAVQYDGADKSKVTLGGTNGTTIDNVKAGVLSANSKEAVNGSQLYSTNQVLAQEISDRQTAVTAESTARESSDTVLGIRIDTESSSRESADTALGTRIDTEITDRQTAVSNEATARSDADAALGVRIDNEITVRENAISQLSQNITTLGGNAVQYDGTDKSKVTLDGTNGTTIDNVKDGTLSATSKEAVNGSQLYSTNQALAQEVTNRTNAVADEVSARQTADTALGARIDTEITDRQTAVSNEATVRSDADNALGVRIDNEITARENAISQLSQNITTLGGNAVQYDGTDKSKVTLDGTNGTTIDNVKAGTLSANSKEAVNGSQLYSTNQALAQEVTDRTNAVADEISARQTADTALGARIDTEITDRQTAVSNEANVRSDADNALGVRIDNEITARENAISQLSQNVTTLGGNAVQYDGTDKSKVTLDGTNGTTIDNVKAGTLSANSKEAVNGSQLYTTNQALAQEISDRQTAVSAETTARESSDTALGIRIDTESSSRESADTALGRRIDTEISDRTTAVSTEAMARSNADAALGNRIDTEITNRTNADNVLDDKITAEITARESAVSSLQNSISSLSGNAVQYDGADKNKITLEGTGGTVIRNIKAGTLSGTSMEAVNGSQLYATNQAISTEVSNRTSADTVLGTRIDHVVSDYQAADAALDSRIGTQSANGNYIKKSSTNNVVANIAVLDTQLKSTNDNLAQEVTDRATAVNTEKTARVNADTALSERIGTVSSDGYYIKKSGTNDVAQNLMILDTKLKATADSLGTLDGMAVQYDAANQSKVTLGGSNGTTIDNVKDGILSASSKEAVNGSQLFKTNQDLATEVRERTTAVNIEKTARENADAALDDRIGVIIADGNYIKDSSSKNLSQNLSLLDSQVKVNSDAIGNLEELSVQYDSGMKDKITLAGAAGTTIHNVKAGTLSPTSKEAVNGSQLYSTNQALAQEISDRQTAVSAETTARESSDTALGVRIDTETSSRESADTALGVRIDTEIADRQTAVSNEATIRSDADAALGVRIDNEITARENAISQLSQDITTLGGNAVQYDGADKSKVTLGGTNGTTIDNVKAGALSADSKEAVNGSQLYQTNQNLAQEATDRINAVNTEKTTRETADTVLSNRIGTISIDGTYIKNSNEYNVSENIGILDRNLSRVDSVLTQEIQDRISAVNTEKTAREAADTALDNRITSLSDNVIHYDDTSKSKVTLAGVGGTTVDNVKAGTLSADSKEAVNGSQLYTTNQNLSTEIQDRTNADTALNQKIDTEISNRVTAVSSEASARMADDILLSDRIGVVDSDQNYIKKSDTNSVSDNLVVLDQQLKTTDTDLRTEITERVNAGNAEKTARENADTALSDRIGTLGQNGSYVLATNNVLQNVSLLDVGLKAEKDAREADVRTLTEAVSGLGSNAVLYDNSSKGRITLSGTGGSVIDNVRSGSLSPNSMEAVNGSQLYSTNVNVSNEIAARQEADTALDGKISNEASIRENAVAGLNDRIAAEVSDRQTAVTDEKNAREAADTALGNRIDTEIVNRTNADSVLDDKINAEISARENAMGQLTDAIGELGDTVLRYDNPIHTRITFAGENGTVLDNVKAGKLSANSKEAVNGSQLFTTNQALAQEVTDRQNALAEKVNVDASNVGVNAVMDNSEAWASAIGTGAVTSGNLKLVTGGMVYDAIEARFGQVNVSDTTSGAVAVGDGSTVNGNHSVAVGDGSTVNGQNSTAIGSGSEVTGNNAVGLGNHTTADGQGATAIGTGSSAEGQNTTVVGGNSSVEGIGSTVVGSSTDVTGDNAVGIGTEATVNGTGSVAVGSGSSVNGEGSSAIGLNTMVTGDNGSAFGSSSAASGTGATAIGHESSAVGDSSVALGEHSVAKEDDVISVGHKATDTDVNGNAYGSDLARRIVNVAEGASATDVATVSQTAAFENSDTADIVSTGTNAIGQSKYKVNVKKDGVVEEGNTNLVTGGTVYDAINERIGTINIGSSVSEGTAFGEGATVSSDGGTAVGDNSQAGGKDAVAVGQGTSATGEGSTAIGTGSTAEGNGAIALGNEAASNGAGAVTIGNDSSSTGVGTTVVGTGATVEGNHSTAIGTGSSVDATDAVAVGAGSSVTGDSSTAVGVSSSASAAGTSAFGNKAEASGSNATALGTNTVADSDNAVAVGHDAVVNAVDGVGLGSNTSVTGTNSVALGSDSVATDTGVISLGHKATDTDVNGNAYGSDLARRIVNVSEGTSASDVATVSQTAAFVNNEYATFVQDGTNDIGQKQYKLNIVTDGVVEEGNAGIVTGGTVYNALKNLGSGTTGSGTNGSTAIGEGSSTTSDNSVAVGGNSTAFGENTVAVGKGSSVEGQNSSVVGTNADVTGDNSVGFGNDVSVEGTGSVAVGGGATVEGQNSTAVGSNADVTGNNAVGLGNDTSVQGAGAVGIGSGSTVDGEGSVALGSDTLVTGTNGSAVGTNSVSSGNGASAVGHGAIAEGNSSVALGENSVALDDNVISLGHIATDTDVQGQAYGSDLTRRIINVADGVNATDAATVRQVREYVSGSRTTVTADGQNALGQDRYVMDVKVDGQIASGNTGLVTGGAIYDAIRNISSISGGTVESGTQDAIAVGNNSTVSGDNSVAVGTGSTVEGGNSTMVGANSVVTGDNSVGFGNDTSVIGEGSVSVGTGSTVEGQNSTAVGTNSEVTGDNSIGLGNDTTVSGTDSVAVGGGASVEGQGATAVGTNSEVTGDNAVGVGNDTTVAGAGAIAIGSGSIVNGEGSVAFGTDTAVTGSNGSAIGNSSVSSGDGATAVGHNANAEGNSSVALGEESVAKEDDVISVGHKADDTDLNGQAYGSDLNRRITNVADGTSAHDAATVSQTAAFVNNEYATFVQDGTNDIGQKQYKLNIVTDGVVEEGNAGIVTGGTVYNALKNLGSGTTGSGTNGSTAIGEGSSTTDDNSVAIGGNSTASGENTVAVGKGSSVEGQNSSAVGTNADVTGNNSVGFGNDVSVEGTGSVAVGGGATVEGQNSSAVGTNADVAGDNSVGFGNDVSVEGTGSVAVGGGATVEGLNSTVVGSNSEVKADDSVAMGNEVSVSGSGSVAVGSGSEVTGDNASAVGNSSVAGGAGASAIGHNAVASGDSSVALGENSVAADADVISVGHKATDTDANGNVYGSDLTRKITNVSSGTVAEGSTDVVTGGQLFETNKAIEDLRSSMGDVANLDLDGLVEEVGKGTVTDGDKNLVTGNTLYNEVRPVSDGRFVKSDNTVAENMVILDRIVSEGTRGVSYVGVNAVEDDQDTLFGGATGDYSSTLGVGSKAEGNDSVAIGHGSKAMGAQSIAIGTGNEVTGNHSGAFGDPNTVSGDDSYVMGNNNTVSGNNSFVLSNNATVTGNNSVVLGNGSDGSMDNVVSVGSKGSERKVVHVARGEVAEGSTDAVTGGQLFDVQKDFREANGVDADKWAEKLGTGTVTDGDGNLVTGDTVYHALQDFQDSAGAVTSDVTNGEIHIGGSSRYDGLNRINVAASDGSSRVITGVATNPDDMTSAANVGYVNAVGQNIINGVNNEFTRVNDRINKVGAGAAAMAGLVPGSYEDGDKWSVSAAVGNYRNATAGAIGAFYKPAENITIALKGSFGNGENMVSGGIGVSLNKGNVPGVTKAQLVKTVNAQAAKIYEIEAEKAAQNHVIAAQEHKIAELQSQMAEVVRMLRNKENSGK